MGSSTAVDAAGTGIRVGTGGSVVGAAEVAVEAAAVTPATETGVVVVVTVDVVKAEVGFGVVAVDEGVIAAAAAAAEGCDVAAGVDCA